MKPLLIIAFTLFSTLGIAQDDSETINWLTNLDEAKKISQEQNKNILIYFTGSDWCAPCVALKKDFFDTPEFLDKSRNYVLVMIDYPRRVDIISEDQLAYNKKVIEKYNSGKSFPNLVMMNNRGRVIDNISGYSSFNTYQDTSHHVAFVDKYMGRNN